MHKVLIIRYNSRVRGAQAQATSLAREYVKRMHSGVNIDVILLTEGIELSFMDFPDSEEDGIEGVYIESTSTGKRTNALEL